MSFREVSKLKALARTCVILVFLLSSSATTLVFANVPTVLTIEAVKDGADAVLGLEIRSIDR